MKAKWNNLCTEYYQTSRERACEYMHETILKNDHNDEKFMMKQDYIVLSLLSGQDDGANAVELRWCRPEISRTMDPKKLTIDYASLDEIRGTCGKHTFVSKFAKLFMCWKNEIYSTDINSCWNNKSFRCKDTGLFYKSILICRNITMYDFAHKRILSREYDRTLSVEEIIDRTNVIDKQTNTILSRFSQILCVDIAKLICSFIQEMRKIANQPRTRNHHKDLIDQNRNKK